MPDMTIQPTMSSRGLNTVRQFIINTGTAIEVGRFLNKKLPGLMADWINSLFQNVPNPMEGFIDMRLFPLDVARYCFNHGTPFDPTQSQHYHEMYMFGEPMKDTTAGEPTIKGYQVTTDPSAFKVATFSIPVGFSGGVEYMNFPPYSTYKIYLPYVGDVDLPADQLFMNNPLTGALTGKTLEVWYALSLNTGECIATVIDTTVVGMHKIIITAHGNCGEQVRMAGGRGYDQAAHAQEAIVTGAAIAGTAVIGAAGAAAAGSAAAGSATSASAAAAAKSSASLAASNALAMGASNLASNTARESLAIGRSTSSVAGAVTSMMGNYMPQHPYITRTCHDTYEPSPLYATLYGRPSMQPAVLADLTGFTQIAAMHVEGVPGATSDELDEIDMLLRTGVIL